MAKPKNPRNYKCKDEELPVIAQYVAFSFQRDQAEFEAFSPKFDAAYASRFTQQIEACRELMAPENETAQLKSITASLYGLMQDILDPLRRLEGYLKLARKQLPMSPSDFGVKALRQGLKAKDTEKLIDALQVVNTNLGTYGSVLEPLGLSEDLKQFFATAGDELNRLNQQQYEILSNRRSLILANVGVMNELYAQLMEILSIGKILYTETDDGKLKEYTFQSLLKQVRRTSGPKTADSEAKENLVPDE
ncbi:hypothetical protein [uncultured Sunxiuqinia sp.]|uniref:hypothetical protein n=1 Tax=uncultured Sunxiuqinia sp. TaxID=1573825 RepID=UPI00262F478B|nr:hypothetical protein [uncultured Sunxiuqinia sp.]